MEYQKFKRIGKKLEENYNRTIKLYKLDVDLTNYSDPYDEIVSDLMEEIYGEDGAEWWSWFCYENDFGKHELTAFDENKKQICYSWKSLHEYLEKNHKRTK